MLTPKGDPALSLTQVKPWLPNFDSVEYNYFDDLIMSMMQLRSDQQESLINRLRIERIRGIYDPQR